MEIASDLIARYGPRISTRRVLLERGLLKGADEALRAHLPEPPWLLVADPNTWRAAGEAVAAGLERAGLRAQSLVLEPLSVRRDLLGDELAVERVREALAACGARAAIAVGAGTVNDLVKLACERLRLPYAAFATAASMNGYTSAIAAPLSRGLKLTLPARPPVLVLADIEVLRAAPSRLSASGFADLLSKPVSTADWKIGELVAGAPFSAEVEAILARAASLVDGAGPDIARREEAALARLFEALVLSGLAMAIAGASSPASGGEHLVSHYLDAVATSRGEEHELHGLQVGVGTIVSAGLYECMLAFDPRSIDPAARAAREPSWPEREAALLAHFGERLGRRVLPHARAAYLCGRALEARLRTLRDRWDEVREAASARVAPAASIAAALRSAGAPTTFASIGVAPERARGAVLFGGALRARYTILQLAHELGTLEAWAEEALRLVT